MKKDDYYVDREGRIYMVLEVHEPSDTVFITDVEVAGSKYSMSIKEFLKKHKLCDPMGEPLSQPLVIDRIPQLGDTVVLKSGGPFMTVETYDPDEEAAEVHCIWFDNAGQLQSAGFPLFAIVVHDRDEGTL